MAPPPLPSPDVIDLFLNAAARFPDKLAVQARPGATYAELAVRARQLAAAFAGAERVLIALPRGVDAYASMLGAALGGGFYTPLNEVSPIEKQLRVTRLLQPDVIVAPRAAGELLRAEAPGARIVDPADLGSAPALEGQGSRHATAYVIFTSGSTGEPKGVVIPRVALNHFVAWMQTSETVVADDVVSQFNNLAFDLSVQDIYGALCTGATLVPINARGDRLMPARAIAREGITAWASVPSVIDLMQTAGQLTRANLGRVRMFTLVGEKLLRAPLAALFAACPDAAVQNTYGPTEATVSVTQMRMSAVDFTAACHGNNTSVGGPIDGMGLHLVDGPDANEGEIVLTGPQVASGYWNDAERTARAFRTIAVEGVATPCFHTGDWAVRRGAHLFFEERIDLQIKLRGYRIELDEVAAAIIACGWPSVCVVKRGEALAALVEDPSGGELDAVALQDALAGKIEAYAVPTHIVAVLALPRNESDKVDRRAAAALLDSLILETGA